MSVCGSRIELDYRQWSDPAGPQPVSARTGIQPLPSFGRAALGLKGSVERGVVALQQGRRVADGCSLVYEAMSKRDLVGRKLERPAGSARYV
jgi:hypothetical protein